ncbi:MAG: class I SAM-dependent methyltransferase [Planctomycetota bacterium]
MIEARDDSLFIDLGYGASPVTTLDSLGLFRVLNPDLRCVGVEIDPERVAAAKPFEGPGIEFRRGGFNLPVEEAESARLIRAFNVLRQYDEDAVREACLQMSEPLREGGLLIEGTSDPFGRVWTAWLHRKVGSVLRPEALVFGTNFKAGFDPGLFQAVLPKALIHRMVPGEPIHALFEAWHRAARATIGTRVFGPRQWWRASLEQLAGGCRGLREGRRDWARGWAVFDGDALGV